jgi:hypothetical protein
MAVFISHAAADAEIAQGLEKFLERRGQFVELDDGETALRPLQHTDVLVLLISQNLVMSIYRLRLEQRALDAWADGRLVLIKLDHALAPVGLRDLSATDASFEAQREFVWEKIAREVQEKKNLRPRAPAVDDVPTSADDESVPYARSAPAKSGGLAGVLLALVLIAPGIAALCLAGSIYLANRIGPIPQSGLGGELEALQRGLDAFGLRYGVTQGSWIALGALGLSVLVILFMVVSGLRKGRAKPLPAAPRRRTSTRPQARTAAPGQTGSAAVFVSYARANAPQVLPVIDAVKQAGKRLWLDQQSLAAGDGWAAEIVRAIRGAPEVLVMCSRAAFESDHVKREIYLADRYKKKLVPVFVEAAEPPEDFEYFFAGVQFLNLFETPEAERPAALMRVLEA